METEKTHSLKRVILEKVFWITILIIVIVAIALLILSSAPKIYTIVDGEEVTKDYYSINETVMCNEEEITVTNVQEKTNNEDAGISKGEKLVAITYKIKNNSDNEEAYYLSDFNVVTSTGEVIKPRPMVFTDMWNGEFFNTPTLAAGGTKEGYHVFVINENDNDYYTQFVCSYNLDFTNTYIKIKLN